MHHLPHEVSDVQPVLDMLSRQDPTEDKVRLTVYFHSAESEGMT